MRTLVIGLVFGLFACGDDVKFAGDADPPTICGNGVLERGEDCDDDDEQKDTVCDATCHFTCGNGAIDSDVGELCDTGIASGTGACPTSCDDANACTDDVKNSSACTVECFHSTITAAMNGDGCCPVGADATNDSDCSAVCGNGSVETGETCDTGIVAGAGACPMVCNDLLGCTSDVLANGTTCQAACTFTPITLPANGDGCCPSGGTSANDTDCLLGCGNGIVDPGEACDTAITTGAGKCPTTCSDGVACTTDTLGNPGTCQAICVFPPITMAANNDGCCPAGANANNDNNCTPSCGNAVVEQGEQCDDGNMTNTDACSNSCKQNPVAFRFSDLDARDPHAFVSIIGCQDVTNSNFTGFSVNGSLQTSITTDATMPPDGKLDLSPTLVFRSFAQTGTTPVEFHFASCSAPMASTSCSPSGNSVISTTATNMATGQCLAPIAGTLHPYMPTISSPSGPCFSTSTIPMVTINLGGIPVTLRDARIAATYVGNPATAMANGLLMGFISEADANTTIIPSSFPLVGGKPLSSLLPGGSGNCASPSDKDVNNGVTGWWFYLNFPATRVPWVD